MEYSPEQLNYFRICHVGFNLIPVGLRQIFRNEWDFRYKTSRLGEWKDTQRNGRDFYDSESRRSRTKNARYLATIQNGDLTKWDCSCLVFAILYSDSIGTTLSSAVSKDVNELRQVCNDISHISEAKLPDAEFQTFLGRVLHAYTSLGLPIREIEDEKNQTRFPTEEVEKLMMKVRGFKSELDQTKSDLGQIKSDLTATTKSLEDTRVDLFSSRQESKTPTPELSLRLEPFCLLTLKPPHEVIRRSSEIERISNKMQEIYNSANGAVSAIYLSGTPGCGKSQLARQLGSKFFSDNAKDMTFVAMLNAESIDTLADSYISLGKHLGIIEYTLTNAETPKREKPSETIEQLQRLILPTIRQYSKWLIIADNVVDLTLVRSFLPQTGSEEWGHGQVLIITQDSSSVPYDVPHTYHESLSKGMQVDDAVELLEKVSQISDREQTRNVAKVLDYQPLALAAAAYHVQTVVRNGSPNYGWTVYLKELTHSHLQRTKNLAIESSVYSKTTSMAVEMVMERAVETDEVLRRTFSFFALCACEALPLDAVVRFVMAQITDQPVELIKTKLLTSSLLIVSAEEEELYLGLHDIVYAVLQQGAIWKHKSLEKFQNMAEGVKVFKSLLDSSEQNYPLLKSLTTHCKSLLEHVTSHLNIKKFVENCTLLITADEVAGWLGSFARACNILSDYSFGKYVVDLGSSVLDNVSDTDEGELLKGFVLSTSGEIYQDIGDHNKAIQFHQMALSIRKKIFVEDHPDVARTYGKLGLIYDRLGEYNQAKEFYKKALMIQKNIFGEEHSDVAKSYSNLGLMYQRLGEYHQAKEFLERALMDMKKIFGEEHPDVAGCYCNLGIVYQDIGQHIEAKGLLEKSLMINKKFFDEEHPNVATGYNNLGGVYKSIGECNHAKTFYKKALTIWKKNFGEEHPDVATCYSNLGLVHISTGEHYQAKEFIEKALMIRKRIFGEEHPNVATSYNNLGHVFRSIGEYNQAKECYNKALKILKTVLGEEHPHVATSYGSLGIVYNATGEFNEAKELLEKALMIDKKIFTEDHPDVARSYNNLGMVYSSIGEYNQAKGLFQKALMIWRGIFGEEHPDVATSYTSIGLVHYSNGEYIQAKEFYEKAFVMQKKFFGEEHPDIATSYNNLALVHCSLGEYNQAKEFYEKAWTVQKTIFGNEHPDVATSYNKLGWLHFRIGEYNQAKEFYEKALIIRKRFFGEEHPDVATCYSNLGLVYNSIGEHREAKERLEKALMINTKIFGEEHPNVAAVYNNLGVVYASVGDDNEAKFGFRTALENIIKLKNFMRRL